MRSFSTLRRRVLAATMSIYAFQAVVGANATVIVNEFHYDNSSTDTGEFIELAGTAGTSLTDWSLVLYNGTSSQRSPYRTVNLSGTFTDQSNGWGFLSFDTAGLQNGPPDGFALVDNNGSVVEFLSYEGTFEAASGLAAGMTSTDVGVSEGSGTPAGHSLQRTGTGLAAGDFTWATAQANTRDAVNTGQTFDTPTGGGGGGTDPTPTELAIYEIQGAGHTTAHNGDNVRTTGVVTGVISNGFYLQDPTGDSDDATSDGIFVFTGGAPTVSVGDVLDVTADVSEFRRSSEPEALTLTELVNADITVTGTGATLPPAIVLGTGGRLVPTEVIDNDSFGTFDPTQDGIDFYESLEGMRVTLPDAQSVSLTSNFGETYAVGNSGANATGMNANGGITLTEGDFNPERLEIQPASGFTSEDVNVGDKLGNLTGFLNSSRGDYELVLASDVVVTEASTSTPEVTTLVSGQKAMTVATFNALLQNNFGEPTQAQIDAIAAQIVNNLRSPDVIGLQEVQTAFANGGGQALIDAIVAAGGPEYKFAFVDGNSAFNSTSIQPAFLYTDNVQLEGLELMPNGIPTSNSEPFDGGQRVPLVATFSFGGETFTIVNNHFDSKSGGSPLFGATQPPNNGGEADRLAQAALVNAFVDGLLSTDPSANVIVLGDLNEFDFEDALKVLEGMGIDQVLDNANQLVIDVLDRYSYNFEGNAQQLDHILLSLRMFLDFDLALDFLHINSDFAGQASDHDPLILRIASDAFAPVPLPGAVWMMLIGLAGVFASRRRRQMA